MQVNVYGRSFAPAGVKSIREYVVTVEGKSDDTIPVGSIVLCIDVSGSMDGNAIEAAKATACSMIQAFPGKVTVVSFNDAAKKIGDYKTSDKELCSLIKKIKATGGTNIYAALVEATKYFKIPSDELSNNVFLLSDGKPQTSATEEHNNDSGISAYAKEMKGQGFMLSTFGIGDNYLAAEMTGWAKDGGGSFFDIARHDQIEGVMSSVSKMTAVLVAKDCLVKYLGQNGAKITKVWKSDAAEHGAHIGHVYNGEKVSLLVSVELPDTGEAQQITDVVSFCATAGDLRATGTGSVVFIDNLITLDEDKDPDEVYDAIICYKVAQRSESVRDALKRSHGIEKGTALQHELCDWLAAQKRQTEMVKLLLAKAHQTEKEISEGNVKRAVCSSNSTSIVTGGGHSDHYMKKIW